MFCPDPLLCPPATRLVHIGPFKTGTTSLQSALNACRAEMEKHGVHFACPESQTQPAPAVLAVTGSKALKGNRAPQPEDWTNLMADVRDAGDKRVILSSEFFSDADDASIRRVLSDVPGGPVHVVVTLRPLVEIAPSQWQQHVQNGLRTPYVTWLHRLFEDPDDRMTSLFWRRHDHGTLVRRWAEAAGPHNLTVVVADKDDPGRVLRTFESLVGLPDGLLQPARRSANRSLLPGEVELVRQINEIFDENDRSEAWSETAYKDLVRGGLIRRMKTGRSPGPQSPGLVTPDWAQQRLAEVGRESAKAIADLGVDTIGDLHRLSQVSPHDAGEEERARPSSTIPVDAAALALVGAMHGPGAPRDREKVAAGLSTLGMPGEAEESTTPAVEIDAAVRAVSAVIASRDEWAKLAALPAVPADVAGMALAAGVNAAAAAPGGHGPAKAISALDALGVKPTPKPAAASRESGSDPTRATARASAAPTARPNATSGPSGSAGRSRPGRPVALEKRRIDKATTHELLTVIAHRVGTRLARGLSRRD